MTEIRKEIERILSSDTVTEDELSQAVNSLRDEGRSDIIGSFTRQLLAKHFDDIVLMLRAWYLISYEENYKDAENILRTIGQNDSTMFAILRASIALRMHHDADAADEILEQHPDHSGLALEAARLFIFEGFADIAEKWIYTYDGEKDTDYLMVYAEILIANEEYEASADIYRRITKDQPGCAEAWTRLSDVLITMKDYTSAAEAARRAELLGKGSRKAAENLRVCSLCLNRHNKSRTINPKQNK